MDSKIKPVAWVLRREMDSRVTKCSAHLWFSDPVNCMWMPIYDQAALDAAVAEERERWSDAVFYGHRVFKALRADAARRTSYANVSDTLDALMSVIRI